METIYTTLPHREEAILKIVKHYIPDIYNINILAHGEIYFFLEDKMEHGTRMFAWGTSTRRALELLRYLPAGVYLKKVE